MLYFPLPLFCLYTAYHHFVLWHVKFTLGSLVLVKCFDACFVMGDYINNPDWTWTSLFSYYRPSLFQHTVATIMFYSGRSVLPDSVWCDFPQTWHTAINTHTDGVVNNSLVVLSRAEGRRCDASCSSPLPEPTHCLQVKVPTFKWQLLPQWDNKRQSRHLKSALKCLLQCVLLDLS